MSTSRNVLQKKQDVTPSPILKHSLANLNIPLRTITGWKDVNVTMDTSDTFLHKTGSLYGKVKFPLFGLRVSSVEKNFNSIVASPAAVRHRGVKGAINKVSEYEAYHYFFHLVPVIVTVDLTMYTKDKEDIWDLINGWMYNDNKAKFELEVFNSSFSINIELESSLEIPEAMTDKGDTLEVHSTLRVSTYVGEVSKVAAITAIKYQLINLQDAKNQCPDDVTPVITFDIPAIPE